VNPPEAVSFPFDSRRAVCVTPSTEILREAQQVSELLNSLAEKHPLVSEALISISGNVRRTTTLLEGLVVRRMGPCAGRGPANARTHLKTKTRVRWFALRKEDILRRQVDNAPPQVGACEEGRDIESGFFNLDH